MQISMEKWNAMVAANEVTDISNEMPDGFLVIGQVMRAKIVWQGKKYYASGWQFGFGLPYVELKEVEGETENGKRITDKVRHI